MVFTCILVYRVVVMRYNPILGSSFLDFLGLFLYTFVLIPFTCKVVHVNNIIKIKYFLLLEKQIFLVTEKIN